MEIELYATNAVSSMKEGTRVDTETSRKRISIENLVGQRNKEPQMRSKKTRRLIEKWRWNFELNLNLLFYQ